MQLAMLRAEPSFLKMSEKVVSLAGMLESKSIIPMIAAQLPLLQEVQSADYWRHATLASLEDLRLRVRPLAKLVEPDKRPIVNTDFHDELAAHLDVPNLLPAASPGVNIERLGAKAQHFLTRYESVPAIQHLKWNEPITRTDIQELERIFLAEGTSRNKLATVSTDEAGLGLFVRSLVGLDRTSARQSFQSFLAGKTLAPNQTQFVELIVDLPTRRGYVDPAQLFNAPFTDSHPQGVSGLFSDPEIGELLRILTAIRSNAQSAMI